MDRFSDVLRTLREKCGLSQRQLAEATGHQISNSYISMIETGDKPPPKRKIVKAIAAALGDTSGRLLELADHDKLPPGAQEKMDKADERLSREMFNKEKRDQISWNSTLLAGRVSLAVGASGGSEEAMIADFNMKLFWKLLQYDLVDRETCERFADWVERTRGKYAADWPKDLPHSPYDLVHTLTFRTDPPDFERAEEILACIEETFASLVPGKKASPSPVKAEPPGKPEGAPGTPPEEPKPPIHPIGS